MFRDRHHAATLLIEKLDNYPLDKVNTVVVALPRGGVPIAGMIAKKFDLPLEIVSVKKIGYPVNPELALGAITEAGDTVINEDIRRASNLREDEIEEICEKYLLLAKAKAKKIRGEYNLVNLNNKDILLVDDGIATGASIEAAIKFLKNNRVNNILIATPVASKESLARITHQVDKIITIDTPSPFLSVGRWFECFEQVEDDEVEKIVLHFKKGQSDDKYLHIDVTVNCNGNCHDGSLVKVANEKAWVVFAHGSGSSHLSPRNNLLASKLNAKGFSTLLFDLLTPIEDREDKNRFNITLLSERLVQALKWLMQSDHYNPATPIGLFGASTGAAAALVVASKFQDQLPIFSIVSRGGRPDLVGVNELNDVMLPVLLIVGAKDYSVIELNEIAHNQIYKSKIQLIANATHLFDEPGTLEKVAELTTNWFQQQLPDSTNTTHQQQNNYSIGELGFQL